ncbi:MAG: 30S ribosomal protein S16 [Bacteroidales bacterium]|nr:30S ribosomal protein S16 [Bacteroidales bacterium]
MMLKLRLARHGRKRHAYYHIVAADSRAPRDGKYIEQIGVYNPNIDPAYIDIDFDKSLDWLHKGAQPTETVRAILSYKGVLYKKHLLEGVKKGAFDEKVAEERFQKWLQEKEAKIQAKRDKLISDSDALNKTRFEAEIKVKEEKAEALAKKFAVKEEAEEETVAETTADVTEPEAKAEEPVTEEKTEDSAAKVEETTEVTEPEAKAEEPTETKPEAKEEVEPVTEEKVTKETNPEEPKAKEKKEDEPKA